MRGRWPPPLKAARTVRSRDSSGPGCRLLPRQRRRPCHVGAGRSGSGPCARLHWHRAPLWRWFSAALESLVGSPPHGVGGPAPGGWRAGWPTLSGAWYSVTAAEAMWRRWSPRVTFSKGTKSPWITTHLLMRRMRTGHGRSLLMEGLGTPGPVPWPGLGRCFGSTTWAAGPLHLWRTRWWPSHGTPLRRSPRHTDVAPPWDCYEGLRVGPGGRGWWVITWL